MPSRVIFTVEDYSGESSSFGVEGIDVDSANYDAQQTEAIALSTAVANVSIGTLAERKFVASIANPESGQPASQYAQRELKWLVTYVDTVTGDLQQSEIPCPDLTLLVAGTDLMNTAAGAGAALKTAWDAFVQSKAGNAVSLTTARLVGRNI